MSWNTALSSAAELAERLRSFEARRGLYPPLQADADRVAVARQVRPAAVSARAAAAPTAPFASADLQTAGLPDAGAGGGEAIFVKPAPTGREAPNAASDGDVSGTFDRDHSLHHEAQALREAMTADLLETDPVDADVMARRSARCLIPEDLEDFDTSGEDDAPTLGTVLGERRHTPRKQQVIAAYLTAPGMTNIIPARIIDMSATGARVEMTPLGRAGGVPAASLPDRFILVLRHDRIEFDCEIAWQKEWLMGVRFLGMSRPTSDKR